MIYIVDDQEDDRQLIHYELEKQCSPCHILSFPNAACLFHNLQDPTRHRLPNLVLLHLHMPDVDGLAVVDFIRTNPIYRRIPVIMMAHRANQDELMLCYDKGSNAFMTKPLTATDAQTMVARIKQFWLDVAQLPTGLK